MDLLLLDPRDNIAVAIRDLHKGEVVTLDQQAIPMTDDVIRGHKVAIQPIPDGSDVIRYGEVIGGATSDVEPGQHVHVHNLISRRIPGRAS